MRQTETSISPILCQACYCGLNEASKEHVGLFNPFIMSHEYFSFLDTIIMRNIFGEANAIDITNVNKRIKSARTKL